MDNNSARLLPCVGPVLPTLPPYAHCWLAWLEQAVFVLAGTYPPFMRRLWRNLSPRITSHHILLLSGAWSRMTATLIMRMFVCRALVRLLMLHAALHGRT